MSLNPAVTARYNLGPVKPWVESAAYLIGPKFGIKTIYGWRASDPFPDHPSGHALDFMVSDKAQGQAVADYLQQNASALGVKYIIWNRQVWESSGKPVVGWHPYTSTSNPHTDHVHVTFLDQPGTGAVSATDVSLASTGPNTDPTCSWGYGSTCLLSKVAVRDIVAVLLIGGGVVVGLVGVALMLAHSLKGTAAGDALLTVIPAGKVLSRV